jgi:putative membrane-bound dehydrogenase-like protein
MKRLPTIFSAALSLLVTTFALSAADNIPATGADGRLLNLGFEDGTLHDWTATGDAFEKQPVKGEIDQTRQYGKGRASKRQGDFWIGGFEIHLNDKGKGTLTSVEFKVSQPWGSFLIGGGSLPGTRVEIVTKDDGKVIHTARGANREEMARSVVDLRKLQGREIFIRITDEETAGWGHVNFDDFIFHAEAPKFSPAELAQKPGPKIDPNLKPDEVQFAGLPAEKAAQVATVPAGYELKVFAAEPDIINPIAFCMDDRARVWVVEGMTYPQRAKTEPGAPEWLGGKDRILVFEDTDGDGKADKRTVFMEGLNLVSGIEVGFGGVFVGAAPNLIFIPVENWDDPKPGKAEVLLNGWGGNDTHETLNTFHWGPDGWLYGCHGVFTHSLVGKPGAGDAERVKLNAGIWRYQPQRKEFEVFAHGTSNPWGIDWNADGDLFAEACVIPHLFHIIQGARYQRQAGQHFDPHTYDDIKTIADHRHFLGATPHGGNGRSDAAGGGHAHAGLCIPQHPSWPDGIRGNVLMNNIHGARINMDVLERQGSGYVAHHGADFINFHDKASQIVDLREGPDGTLWMIDWYDLNQCHNNRREAHDYTTGRIFRLAKKGARIAPRDFGKMDDVALYKAQALGNEREAAIARRLLQEKKMSFEDVGRLIAKAERDPETNPGKFNFADATPKQALYIRRGFWLQAVTGDTANKELKDIPDGKSWEGLPVPLAVTLLRMGKVHPDQSGVVKALTEYAASKSSPIVRLALASACQRLTVEQRKPIVLALLAHEEDKDDPNLPLMDWYAAEPIVAADPAWAAEALAACKIPKVSEFIARRLSEK